MMRRSPLKPSIKPMKRTPFVRTLLKPSARTEIGATARMWKPMKSKQLAVTPAEEAHWDRLASIVGCVACLIDGHYNNHVSIHHCDGRTKPGCHMRVLPLCAGHHQDGTGEDKTMIAVHPWKARFEQRYGTQAELIEFCETLLAQHDANQRVA